MDQPTPSHLLPLSSFTPLQPKNNCIIITLTNLLTKARIILPERFTSTFSQSKPQICLTILANVYFIFVFIHAIYYALEIMFGYASAGRDQSFNSLKNAIFNSRYGIMIFKSALLFLIFRYRSRECMEIAGDVAVELKQCDHKTRVLLYRCVISVAVIIILLVIVWEIMDFAMWEMDFVTTLTQQIDVGLISRKIPLWNLLLSWYLLASPVNILMNLAMTCLASIVLGLFASWRQMNARLIEEKHVYLLTRFEGDWERLRKLAERTDDVFSISVFFALMADIACAVGYVGSIVVYGAGQPLEQVYTIFGLVVHAFWYPAGYLMPCILFHEEVGTTRSLVISAMEPLLRNNDTVNAENEVSGKTMTHLSLIASKISYQPEAFTAWKFFYVTRNVVLTISTVLVSYALILVQLIGRKQDVQGVVNLINEKMNTTTTIPS